MAKVVTECFRHNVFIPIVAQFLKQMAIRSVQIFLKAGCEAINKFATVTNVIKSTLKQKSARF